MKELEGLSIARISMMKDGEGITFWTNTGPVSYYAFGDCCSSSWIEHVEGVDALLYATVTSVESWTPPGNYLPRDTDQSCTKVYGWKFVSNKGWAGLEMRNESNGYYGGDMELVSAVYDEIELKEDWNR